MYRVIVPATSANLGPGFDCMGVALNLYNMIDVEESGDGLQIEINGLGKEKIPINENNLIYKSMKLVFDRVGYAPKGLRIIQTNEIPLTRGLGSSAACIVGGIFAANQIIGQKLTLEELEIMAAIADGHPDNTTPVIRGGLVTTVLEDDEVYHVDIEIPDNLKFAAFIPDFTLSTAKARRILPGRISHKDAVFNAGRAALLVASLVSGKFENLAHALEDRLHQPYRKKLIPDMDRIFEASMKNGAKGCYLSGAGPTLISILDNHYEKFLDQMNLYLETLSTGWEIKILELNKKGVEIFVI